MSRVAYIVIGWNNVDLLEECFDSIYSQTAKDRKIIYVDNDSKDESVKFVKDRYPEVNIIEPGYNTGFAKGNNIGISTALEDKDVSHVALVNTDARLDRLWSETIISFAEQKPKGAMFQGITLDYYDHNVMDSTHVFVARNGQATQGGWRIYKGGAFGPKKVFGVNAAACIISRKFLDTQPFGGQVFDERMFMYLEDVDIAARATLMGWDNYAVPSAIAYHMGSASSGKNPNFSLYMTFRNNSALLYKNLPLVVLGKLLPHLVRADVHTFRNLRKSGRNSAAWKVLEGRIVGLLYIPFYYNKRRKMHAVQNVDRDYIWKLMGRGY